MTAVDMLPCTLNRGAGFRLFAAGLDPRYVEMCATATYNDILCQERDRVWEYHKQQIAAHLSDFPEGMGPVFSMQLDLWTSSSNEPYGALSISYVDRHGIFRRRRLAVRVFRP